MEGKVLIANSFIIVRKQVIENVIPVYVPEKVVEPHIYLYKDK